MSQRKVKSLGFMPRAIPFSQLTVNRSDGKHQDADIEIEFGEDGPRAEDIMVENDILQMIYSLGSDKERCVFMFQLLREYGFNFDHKSSAKALHINWRWYMRVKSKVQGKLQEALNQ